MEMRKGNTIFFIHYCLLDMFFHKSNLSATNLILSNIGKKERGKGGAEKRRYRGIEQSSQRLFSLF